MAENLRDMIKAGDIDGAVERIMTIPAPDLPRREHPHRRDDGSYDYDGVYDDPSEDDDRFADWFGWANKANLHGRISHEDYERLYDAFVTHWLK